MGEILEKLGKAVLEYDGAEAENWARKAEEEKIDPVEALRVLTKAVRQIGDGYGRGELWLPDLIGAASAMQRALPIIEEQIKRQGKTRESLGLVVIGTVLGDIHNIGKSMVATLLIAEGFEVIDLGINVNAEKFIEVVKEQRPEILAMSALMTMTAPEQAKVIKALKDAGLRDKVKIAVGGGAITEDFAREIGADGYAPTAVKAAGLAKKLIQSKAKSDG